MTAQFSTPTDELLLLAETLGEVKSRTEKLETEFSTQARPLEAATNALSAALSGIKALQFHVLDNNLGALSARVEEMRKAVDEQVGVIALELKKADETNAAKAGADAEALRSEIVALQSQLGSLVTQFGQQLERVEFAAKEEAKKLQLIPGPAGAAGASLNPRGTFIDGETYNRLDVVSWLGSSYIATVDGVTEKPSKNSNQWQTLASRGGGGAGGVGDFGSLAGVAQINQGGTGQTTRAAALNALLPDQAGSTQYMLLTDGSGTVSWGAQPVAGLPSQTSNSGRLLTTNGSTASWSNAVTVSGSNATVGGTLTVNGDVLVSTQGKAIYSQGYVTVKDVQANLLSRGTYLGWTTGLHFYSSNTDYSATLVHQPGNGDLQIYTNATSSNYTASDIALQITTGKQVQVKATTDSTTKSDGALVVSGGVGVEKNIIAGSGIAARGTLTLPAAWTGTYGIGLEHNNATATSRIFFGDGTGYALKFASRSSSATTDRMTLTDTGNLTVGGMIKGSAATHSGSPPTGVASAFQVDVENATNRDVLSFGDASRAGLLRGYHDGSGGIRWQFGRYAGGAYDEYARLEGTTAANGKLYIYGTAASTGTSSGALVVSGGVGVAGAIYAGGDVFVVKADPSSTLTRTANTNSALFQLTTGATYDFAFGLRNTTDSDFHLYNYGTSADALTIARASSNATFAGTVIANASSNAFRITTAQTPASASATGTAGTIAWDTSYIYVCTATNTWKRVAIATW